MDLHNHVPSVHNGEELKLWSVGSINGHNILEDPLDQGQTLNCGNFTVSRSSWYRYKMGLLRAGVVPNFTHEVLPIVDEYHSSINELPYLHAVEKGIPLTNGERFFLAQFQKGDTLNTDMMIYELEENGPFPVVKPIYESSSLFVIANPGAVYKHPHEPEKVVSYHAVNVIGHGVEHRTQEQVLVYEDTHGVDEVTRGLGFMGIDVPVGAVYPYPHLIY